MIEYEFTKTSLISIDRSDLKKLREWRNCYSIWKWCRQFDVISELDQERWFEKINKSPDIRMYVITDKEKKLRVGVCGLTDIDHVNRRAEFSLYIAPEYQRNGYAKDALKTLFCHGFDNLNLHIIWGETMEGNKALGLFKKLGMKEEGFRRDFYFKDGNYIGATLVSIKNDEFFVDE